MDVDAAVALARAGLLESSSSDDVGEAAPRGTFTKSLWRGHKQTSRMTETYEVQQATAPPVGRPPARAG